MPTVKRHKPKGNQLAQGDRWLHPTKGWRFVTIKRSIAQRIMAAIRLHQWPWSSRSMIEWDR